MDKQVPFSEIEKEFDLAPILLLFDTKERIEFFTNYLLQKIVKAPSRDFIVMMDELYQNPKEQNVVKMAENIGFNKRQLFRIFQKNYGVSPKVLLNIVRLHLCLTLLLQEKVKLIDIAIQCGFYDQSHFIKEIKRYTGISPLKLLEQYQA